MKLTEEKLKGIIHEEVESNEALIDAIERLIDKMEDLDTSMDYVASAMTGEDPLSIALGQKSIGRSYRSYARRDKDLEEEIEKFKAALKEELEKEGIAFTEEQLEEGWKERVAAVLIGGTLALGGGYLKHQVDAHAQQVKDQITANVDDAVEYKASDAGIIQSLEKQLDNTAAYMWSWSSDPGDVTTLPLSETGAGVLPPEFSVMKQVIEDYTSGAGASYDVDDIIPPSGDSEQNRLNFEEDFSEKEFENWGGGRGIKGSIYPSFGDIDEDYSMPASGKSKSELYVELWNEYVQQPLERAENR